MFLGIVVSFLRVDPAAPPPAEPAGNPLMRHQDCAPLVLLSWHIYITRSTSTYIAKTVNSNLMTTSCITDQRNHAVIRWGALSTADNWSTIDTRIMSRIVVRLFAVVSKHTASSSARRTPVFVRSLSSSQGGVPLFFFDTSHYAASLWLLHVHNAEILPQIIESNQLEWTCNYQRIFNSPYLNYVISILGKRIC